MKSMTRTARGPLERMARTSLRETSSCIRRLEHLCAGDVAVAAEAAITCLQNGGTLYFCGNGGSAADAQHLASELAGRYLMDRPSLSAVALTTNTSSLTAIGNDFGFAQVYSRQLEGVGKRGDVLIALSTSGGSDSVLRAVATARRLGMTVIGMTGARGGRFAEQCDIALVTPSFATPRIQEGHIAMGHTLCELVERAMFGAAAAETRPREKAPPAPRPVLPLRPKRARRPSRSAKGKR